MIDVDPSNPRGIVWLASYPRSGSTWVRIFVNNLIGVQSGADPDDLGWTSQFALTDAAAKPYEQFLGRPAVEAEPAAVAAARTEVFGSLVENSQGLVLVGTNSANVTIFGVPIVTPGVTVGAIYVVRNPLDVVVSLAAFRGRSIDDTIENLATSGLSAPATADTVLTLIGSWSENVSTWTAAEHPALMVVRYEDLCEQPTETFGAIANHVSMQHTPPELAAAIERSSFDRMRKAEAEQGFPSLPPTADRFFRAGRPGQWREALTPAQVERVVSAHGEQMARFGYLP